MKIANYVDFSLENALKKGLWNGSNEQLPPSFKLSLL